ncbi:MAG: 2-isopropylmalate synthase [Deltaproteobacteria bacterium]|nr:2-isopropylmalate synthase [Deltaproteobacteria bacterium]
MPFARYRPVAPLALEDRRWPGRTLSRAPRWCSVDLRDGNQALAQPMGIERKLRLFDALVAIGFEEIEVAFPSASATEFEFVRRLIEEGRVPPNVTIQVVTQCRPDLIERTFAAIEGAPRSIVHFYNSTSPLQRRVVFREDRAGIVKIAVDAARAVRRRAEALPGQSIRFEYSPESFSSTEIEFALEIGEAVLETLGASERAPLILNLPSTVEVSTPNVYADQIEWIGRRLARREAVVLSVHPHNDRGCAVAAAELACLAGADRVEGTLFGNGERTGNVDLVTLALNLMAAGVDPELDFGDLPALVRRVEAANRIPIHPRHPYAGELVFTAFSGSHQDAIRKGLAALEAEASPLWEVPYLPIDPADVGRDYEAVIRINSQSGKGGIAYLLETDAGYRIPRGMQIEFSQVVQAGADASGEEVSSERLRTLFEREYLGVEAGPRLEGDRSLVSAGDGAPHRLSATIRWDGLAHRLVGEGIGPIDAFVGALSRLLGRAMRVGDYHEHVLGPRGASTAVAYVELVLEPGRALYGAGVASSIVDASLAAVSSALGRAVARGWIAPPGRAR